MSTRRRVLALAACLSLLMAMGAELASGDLQRIRSSRAESSTFFDGGKIFSLSTGRGRILSLNSVPARGGLQRAIVSMKVREPYSTSQLMVGGSTYAFQMRTSEYMEDLSTVRVYVAENNNFVPVLGKDVKAPDGTCSWGERLVDVQSNGTVVIEDWRVEGFDQTCEITRRYREVVIVAADKTTRRLASTVTPWGQGGNRYDDQAWEEEGNAVAFVAGLLVTDDGGGSYKLTAVESLSTQFLPDALGDRLWEVAADGRMISLQNRGKRPTTSLFASIAKPTAGSSLDRRNRISYFHFCGDKILEVVRKGKATRERKRSRFWRLMVRNSQGRAPKTLKRQINIGSHFVGCDGDYAHFAESDLRRYWHRKAVAVAL